jgi:hypothetical protein
LPVQPLPGSESVKEDFGKSAPIIVPRAQKQHFLWHVWLPRTAHQHSSQASGEAAVQVNHHFRVRKSFLATYRIMLVKGMLEINSTADRNCPASLARAFVWLLLALHRT